MSVSDDFPSVKLLLCVLCVIAVFGVLLSNEGFKAIGAALVQLREAIMDDFPSAVQAGINQAKKDDNRDIELARLRDEELLLNRMVQRDKAEPFVFTLEKDIVDLLEKHSPGSTTGWKTTNDADTDRRGGD